MRWVGAAGQPQLSAPRALGILKGGFLPSLQRAGRWEAGQGWHVLLPCDYSVLVLVGQVLVTAEQVTRRDLWQQPTVRKLAWVAVSVNMLCDCGLQMYV